MNRRQRRSEKARQRRARHQSQEWRHWYEDDPKYLAEVEVGGRQIKIRTTPEFEDFADSLLNLTKPEEMLRASAWIMQMSVRCVSDPSTLDLPPVDTTLRGKRIPAFTTTAGQVFFKSLKAIEDHDHRVAVSVFLDSLARQTLENACALDPGLVLQACETNTSPAQGDVPDKQPVRRPTKERD